MLRLERLAFCFVLFAACVVAKLPPGASWTNFVSKPVYSRSLGPPAMSGVDTVSVPYMPKSPFFPKFVDPKAMIAKKTDLLTNLFGGLGPAYGPPFKPLGPYMPPSASTLYSTYNDDETMDKTVLGSVDANGMAKRGIFSPFGPKFGPMSPYSVSDTSFVPNFVGKEADRRRKRSVDSSSDIGALKSLLGDGNPEKKDLGPPPAYPEGLGPIPEEPEAEQENFKASGAATPKEYMPGIYGPYGFGGPFGPAVDPSMFIAKKSAFLDTLFKNIATSTPSPTTTTEEPKSTIVPQSFWLPSSVIPSPLEYNAKVSEFLDKLFETLKLNKTKAAEDASPIPQPSLYRSTDSEEGRISRSVQDLSSISAAKDSIVDTILSELGDLKGDMMKTLSDLITYEKTMAISSSSKKPFKPFAGGMWPKPTFDATLPFQQRMTVLGQVFDMLSELQRNITLAVQEAMKAEDIPAANPQMSNYPPFYPGGTYPTAFGMPVYNETLLDAIERKLDTVNPAVSSTKFAQKSARAVPKAGTSFWVAYPESSAAKRQIPEGEDQVMAEVEDDVDGQERRQHARAVQMQMHQGYQSLPEGAVESIQAGGGSVPGHQGGGIKLLDTKNYEGYEKWADWMDYQRNQNEERRHHHNH